MKPEKELERHNRILEQIKNAQTIEELPKIGPSTITSFIANNAGLCGSNFSQTVYQPVTDAILECGTASNPKVLDAFIKVVEDNGPYYLTRNMIITKFNKALEMGRIDYILIEISERNQKIEEFNKKAKKEAHKEIMAQIKAAYEIKDLPKVGLSDLKQKIKKALKNTCYRYLNTAFISYIVDGCLGVRNNDLVDTAQPVVTACLNVDETIEYTVEEIKAIEKRKLEIHRLNHEEIMENIKNAKRISQLPPDLSISTLNKYLLGNSTIYPNDNRLKAEDLKNLVELLMSGKKWEYMDVKKEISRITTQKYPEKSIAEILLYNKLSKLPRTYYLVEEIKYVQERQKEFIKNQDSNVNVYFIPNGKTPVEGGKFYNCYISRKDNIDLASKVPAGMDIDSVEWYIQEYVDDTFKAAGGIILNKDETIGNVSVFRPDDGTIGISPEDKAKMDRIANLDKDIEEKQKLVQSLDIVIANRQQTSSELESKIKMGLINYEKSVLAAQRQLVEHMTQLKNEFGTEETVEEIGGISYTYDKKD